MLTEDGHIKVMDFGLAARLPHSDAVDQTMTVAVARDGGSRASVRRRTWRRNRSAVSRRIADPTSSRSAFCCMSCSREPTRSSRANVDATFAAILAEPVATLHAPAAVDSAGARRPAGTAAGERSCGATSVLRRRPQRPAPLSVDLSPSTSIAPPGVADRADERRQRQADRTRAPSARSCFRASIRRSPAAAASSCCSATRASARPDLPKTRWPRRGGLAVRRWSGDVTSRRARRRSSRTSKSSRRPRG